MAQNVADIRKLLDEIRDEGLVLLAAFELKAVSAKDVWTGEWHSRAHALGRKTAAVLSKAAEAVRNSTRENDAGSTLEEFDPAIAGACNALWLRRFVGKDGGADYNSYPMNQYKPISTAEAQQTFKHAFDVAKRSLNIITGQSRYLAEPTPKVIGRKRGPKPDFDNHKKAAEIVRAHDGDWRNDEDLLERICGALDSQNVPMSPAWKKWSRKPHSWKRALEYHRDRVIKAIEHRLKMAAGQTS